MATVTEIRESRGVVKITFDARESLAVRARHFHMLPLKMGDAVDPGRYVNRVAPTGMIFVPCADGISHNEIESATPEDLAAGCNVLLRAMLGRAVL